MKYLPYLSLMLVFFSCNSPEKEINDESVEIKPDTVATGIPQVDTEANLFVWKVDYDYTKVKNPAINNNILVADSLIKGLNKRYENIYLEKIGQRQDTLYTVIKESAFLTQQMGSTGAETYLAELVLNLTEVPGVRYVNIDLKPGDHMQPGTWSKENFENYKTVK